MKSISIILTLAIVLHAQCGVECLSTELTPAPERPACHEQSPEQPADSSKHDSCGREQVLDSQTVLAAKTSPQWMAVEFSNSAPTLKLNNWSFLPVVQVGSPHISLSDNITVLRI